jgi:hypothetical protein
MSSPSGLFQPVGRRLDSNIWKSQFATREIPPVERLRTALWVALGQHEPHQAPWHERCPPHSRSIVPEYRNSAQPLKFWKALDNFTVKMTDNKPRLAPIERD